MTANNNKKYGIKIEQWLVEDEAVHVEQAGYIKTRKVELNGNGKGDDVATNNVVIK